jgi:hypothetical protein
MRDLVAIDPLFGYVAARCSPDQEAEIGRMQAWLGEQEPSGLAISDWVITEFSAALSMKLRSGQIEAIHRAGALAMFTRLSVDSLTFASVRLAIPHSGTIRGPAYVGLARRRCLASRHLRRSRCNPVHARPSSQ